MEIKNSPEMVEQSLFPEESICSSEEHRVKDSASQVKWGGVNDLRSRLCLTYIDLLKTMRPRWFVWENVPGVFSTNGGEDFRQFVREIDEIGYSLAWRVLDAQYVRVDGFPRAVPQRRRRVFVVGCLMGWEYPAAVLFEPDCLSGNTPPRRIKGKGLAGDFENRAGTAGRIWDSTGVNPTLNQSSCQSGIIGTSNQEIFCQNANGLVMQTSNGEDVADTLDASYYKGVGARNGNERTVISITSGQVGELGSIGEEVSQTLSRNNGGFSYVAGFDGLENCVCYDNHPNDSRVTELKDGVFQQLTARNGTGGGNLPLVQTFSLSSKNSKGFRSESPKGYCHEIDTARTLDTTSNDPNKNMGGNVVCSEHRTVRRLLVVECERLMGFPDNWTRIPWRGKPAEQCPDGPRYKACGNSMCVNVMRWIGMRIELVERKMKREEGEK